MEKRKESVFHDKFNLLSSQQSSEDINWSSSSSSDYENSSFTDKLCTLNKSRNYKRKRKVKVPKNISNLNITIIDPLRNSKSHVDIEKSPILVNKQILPASPILLSNKAISKESLHSSPIIPSTRNIQQKSPIIILKSTPKHSPNVRKRLCYDYEEKVIPTSKPKTNEDYHTQKKPLTKENVVILSSESKSSDTNNTNSSSQAKFDLMRKVKSFFENKFSSDSNSQHISDTPTPESSSKCEEVDILTCKTQNSSIQTIKLENCTNSDSTSTSYLEKSSTKKVKFKKGGLSYRLNALLKKQNAHISLWQHEQFLAGNSNFVIPKEEHILFHVQNLHFKYGCYLLETVDVNFDNYLILINKIYVKQNLSENCVFKLYEPYRILELDKDCKIVINVCKFQCVDISR